MKDKFNIQNLITLLFEQSDYSTRKSFCKSIGIRADDLRRIEKKDKEYINRINLILSALTPEGINEVDVIEGMNLVLKKRIEEQIL